MLYFSVLERHFLSGGFSSSQVERYFAQQRDIQRTNLERKQVYVGFLIIMTGIKAFLIPLMFYRLGQLDLKCLIIPTETSLIASYLLKAN